MADFTNDNLIDIRRLAEAKLLELISIVPFPDRVREEERQRQIKANEDLLDKISDHFKDEAHERERVYQE
jgi:hypothetical protein